MQKYVNASSNVLSVVSHVMRICRQQASSLTAASTSLISFSHCSSSSFARISLSSNALKYGSKASHVVTVKSPGRKCLFCFCISALSIIGYKFCGQQYVFNQLRLCHSLQLQ